MTASRDVPMAILRETCGYSKDNTSRRALIVVTVKPAMMSRTPSPAA
ncbi:MAG: hypothetical protein ACKVS5_02475 [Parvularculaceae bacterium]